MAAVASSQREHGEVQVTGAIDLATAEALGVYEDPDAPVAVDGARPIESSPADAVTTDDSEDSDDSDDSDEPTAPVASAPARSGWPVPAAVAALAAVVAAVLIRRRYVVVQRAKRRRARVHPATSPHRSIADLRRAGRLPAAREPSRRLYDQADERAGAGADEVLSDASR